MIAILPALVLLFRFVSFSRLAGAIQKPDADKMRHYSAIAFGVFVLFAFASFVPYYVRQRDELTNTFSITLMLMGLFVAAFFDFKAERTKRRLGLTAKAEKQLLRSEAAAAELLQKAIKAETKGDLEQAIATYRELLATHPDSALVADAQSCINALSRRIQDL